MNTIRPGWFSEIGPMWPGQAFSLEVTKVLLQEKSEFQDVAVVETKACGKMMTLDGCIQFTDKDEMSYHEMMTHIPCFAHPNPQDILIIGGGDGGIVRELLKHKTVRTITVCDIDKKVTEVSEKYFPNIASGVRDPRVTWVNADGAKFVAEKKGKYDIIITDSSDPVGPAEVLYQKQYYQDLKAAVKPNGIVCSQAESMWLHADLIKALFDMCRSPDVGFTHVQYATTSIMTYPSGTIGMGTPCDKPIRFPGDEMLNNLRFYNPQLHTAAFALPNFMQRKLI